MKNIMLFLSVLISGSLYAGTVGGGGVSGKAQLEVAELMRVYEGANTISRESLGAENLFSLDLNNKIVTFDVERKVLDESAVMTFEEVEKYAQPQAVDTGVLQPGAQGN
jgi:hypothetical protein